MTATPQQNSEERWVRRGPKVTLPDVRTSLGEFLLQRVRGHGAKTVMIDLPSGEEVSGAQLLQRSVAVALELRSRGLGPGDVVSAALDNSLQVAYVLLGTLYIGAIYAPFNPDLHTDDVRHLMTLLVPRLVLCSPRAEAVVRGALAPEAEVVAVGQGRAEWDAFLREPPAAAVQGFQAHHCDDVTATAIVLCSSGTTGPPKGVQHSHRSWQHLVLCVEMVVKRNPPEVVARDRAMQVTPNFWLSGFMSNVLNVASGTPLVVCPKWDVEAVLGGVQRHRVTTLTLTPPQVAAVARHASTESFDVSSLRILSFGGAPLGRAVRALAQRRLRTPLTQYYGQTECLLALLPGPLAREKEGTCGTPSINAEIKVVDAVTGRALGPRAEGEILLRSALCFCGYWRDEAATAQTLTEDGWLRTGDAGYLDEDGYLFVTDRLKELVKYRGVHIAPAEVEGAVTALEGVKDAAVVGIEHEEDQEHPVGFVVRQEGHDVTKEELLQKLRDELPVYKQLHGGVHFVDEIPRTATGKIKRRELRQLARELREQSAPPCKH